MARASIARARWEGSTVDGAGTASTASPALDATPLTWRARIGEEPGTTPEELLAASWAGCLSMALSYALAEAGHEPRSVEVEVEVGFGPQGDGFGIHEARIELTADVPGIAEERFQELAAGAHEGCPVSAALAGNVASTLSARLLATA